jgi:hypothetical protein
MRAPFRGDLRGGNVVSPMSYGAQHQPDVKIGIQAGASEHLGRAFSISDATVTG